MVPPGSQMIVIQAKAELHPTAQSPAYPHFASQMTTSFSHTPYSLVSRSRDSSFNARPGSRDTSFTTLSDSRDSSFNKHGPGSEGAPSRATSSAWPSARRMLVSMSKRRSSKILPAGPHDLPKDASSLQASLSGLEAAGGPDSQAMPQQRLLARPLLPPESGPVEVPLQSGSSHLLHHLQSGSCAELEFTLQTGDQLQQLEARHALTSLAQVHHAAASPALCDDSTLSRHGH